jgi:hypothetical protein
MKLKAIMGAWLLTLGLGSAYAANPETILGFSRETVKLYLMDIWTALYSLSAVYSFYVARVSKDELFLWFGLVFTGMTAMGISSIVLNPTIPADFWIQDTFRGAAALGFFVGLWYFVRKTKV